MKIVAYQYVAPNRIIDSEGSGVTCMALLDALDYLSTSYGDNDTFRVSYDLEGMLSPVLRLLTKEQGAELLKNDELNLHWDTGEGVIDYYVKFVRGLAYPWAVIRSRCRNTNCVFNGVAGYDFLDEFSESPSDVKALVEKLFRSSRSLSFYPHAIYSPINILKPYLKKLNLPQREDIPMEARQYAVEVGVKYWREAHVIGRFDDVSVVDLSSAYPTEHKQVLDLRYGRWEKKKGFDHDATYGHCKCILNIYPKVTYSPIISNNPDSDDDDEEQTLKLGSYIGTRETFLSKRQIDFVNRWKIGSVDVIDGCYFYADKYCPKPMMSFIEKLQDRKKNDPDPFTRMLAKLMVNGLWGYLRQVNWDKGELGVLNNPVYAAEVVPPVALKVADIMYRRKIKPLHIAVDSFSCQGGVELTDAEKAIGWKNDFRGEMLVVSSGRVYYGNRKPGSMTLEEIKKMVAVNPKSSRYVGLKRKVIGLNDAINAGGMDNIGSVGNYITSLDLNKQKHSRQFDQLPRTGEDLLTKVYTSTPFEICTVDGKDHIVRKGAS